MIGGLERGQIPDKGLADWNEWHVCCATLSMSQEEGYVIVNCTSAKMEGRNILNNGYDVVVEVYHAQSSWLRLDERGHGELNALSKQALFVYWSVMDFHQQCPIDTRV